MVEAWQGTLSTLPGVRQHQLFTALNVNGLCAIDTAATIVPNEGCGELDVDDAEMPYELAKVIRADRRVIVTCWPGELGQILQARGLSSPHGSLPNGNVPHHALYVFGASGESFEVYDPWHTDEGQPLHLAWDELVRAWTGMMLVATK
jgi:hypothetical protein